jgi:hypothetical protein
MPLKSQFIAFHDKKQVKPNVTCKFGEIHLRQCDHVYHLGHEVFGNVTSYDVDGVIASFYRQFNSLRSKFFLCAICGTLKAIFCLLFKFLWIFVAPFGQMLTETESCVAKVITTSLETTL